MTQQTHRLCPKTDLRLGTQTVSFYPLAELERRELTQLSALPFSIRVLLECLVRHQDRGASEDDIRRLCAYDPQRVDRVGEIPFFPARVLLQDFTGVPAVVDLAAMRSAMARLGGDPQRINPLIPADLVIDHSVQVDAFASPQAAETNVAHEFARNAERYAFLRWGQQALHNFRVIPPASGICHQVNLEYLAPVVELRPEDSGAPVAFPDTLVGTDSHTTMINGLGVVGWGVGGIEAEAVMLGQPLYMLCPEVVGVRLSGSLAAGATATDLTLTVTQRLRETGVVNKFVEFCGPGLGQLSLADRATIANMAPEYGATIGFFPVDAETLRYLRSTGRPDELVERVATYCQAQELFYDAARPEPQFSAVVDINLSDVVPSLAGPKRPQDRVALVDMKAAWRKALVAPINARGFALPADAVERRTQVTHAEDTSSELGHGAVVIAAITSCTNTSNPAVMIAAGLVAQKAVARGLGVPPFVKTSLAPGSRVVTDYLGACGLTPALEQLGFHTVGYGCTTCIGNSGPLPEAIASAIQETGLIAASVLSGNRNFEGRVHPLTRANYLASPPLVVVYALAGTVDIDLTAEPLGTDPTGAPVFLKDIWPTPEEIAALLGQAENAAVFRARYAQIDMGSAAWEAIPVAGSDLYAWDEASSYIQEPPFFLEMAADPPPITPIEQAHVLVKLGDSVTTDHISPAGSIAKTSPAAQYLQSLGVLPEDFNSYGSRRGNDRVMTRGTFANIRLKNQLAPGTEGGMTTHFPTGEVLSIYDAAQRYQAADIATVVLAGADYGMGSSRDWAAKGTYLLGVRAVIATSFERIHRSNLVGMGILPLQFQPGEDAAQLGLSGEERFTIVLDAQLAPRQEMTVQVEDRAGQRRSFTARSRIDTPIEVTYYRNGGILHTVLRRLLRRG